MKRLSLVRRVAALIVAVARRRAQSKLNVMTTTEDLASIAREVGGDHITVESIARGYQDPHFVEAKPSFILKLQKADLLVVGRTRARDRLAAAADPAEPQREDPAGRARAIWTRRWARRFSRFPTGTDHAGDGRCPPARQPALLDGSRERQAHRQADRRQAVGAPAGRSRRTSSSGWPTSPRGSTPRRSAGWR